ncbi:hypothetical protein O6H91_22G009300 [Diphasiastrum complanatum]|uniref:Uncharacterized protein n=1 Tax=Diphasiastrum complanatum TaxID=34168 RepID=A0ACC2ACS7_DIPCM|nr:hypothetical protein O6H91_22G009300 [Diphasiastrum complanatum]
MSQKDRVDFVSFHIGHILLLRKVHPCYLDQIMVSVLETALLMGMLKLNKVMCCLLPFSIVVFVGEDCEGHSYQQMRLSWIANLHTSTSIVKSSLNCYFSL